MFVIKGKYKKEKYLIDEHYFKTWSHDMAYILGFMMADGCVHDDGNCIKVEVKPGDKSVLDFISSKITPDYRIRFTKRGTEARWHPSSQIMKEDLGKLGVIPCKTGRETLPQTMPEGYFWDFVRGYFDGDGCVEDMLVSTTCNSGDFLKSIYQKTGLGYIGIDRMNHRWIIERKDQLQEFFEKLYHTGSYKLERKYNLMADLLQSPGKSGIFTPSEDLFLMENRNGKTRRELAVLLGRNSASVKNRLNKLGIKKAA